MGDLTMVDLTMVELTMGELTMGDSGEIRQNVGDFLDFLYTVVVPLWYSTLLCAKVS